MQITIDLNEWEFMQLAGSLLKSIQVEESIGHKTCAQNAANVYRKVYETTEFGVELMVPPPPLPYRAVFGVGE